MYNRRALLLSLGSLVIGATALATPARAQACGMLRTGPYFPRRNPAPLLVRARTLLREGAWERALPLATDVTRLPRSTPAQKAEAWAMVGVIRFERNQLKTAQDAFRRARALPGGEAAVDGVLAEVTDADLSQRIRQVLAA